MPIPRIPQWIYYLCPPHPTPSLSFLFHGLCLTYLILAFYTPSCPARSNSNSAPSPLIIIQHPIHISSLPHSLFFSNVILANWAHPSLKTGQDQSNLLLFYVQIPWYLIKVEHATLSKSWVFGSCFLSELENTVYNNSIFHIGLATKFSTNLEGLLHFSPPYLSIQASLQLPPSILTPTIAIQPNQTASRGQLEREFYEDWHYLSLSPCLPEAWIGITAPSTTEF